MHLAGLKVDFPEGVVRLVEGLHGEVIVCRLAGQMHAYANCCPHQGRALDYVAGKFLLTDDANLVCPAHGATFDLRSGHCLSGPCAGACLRRLPLRLDGEKVWLDTAVE